MQLTELIELSDLLKNFRREEVTNEKEAEVVDYTRTMVNRELEEKWREEKEKQGLN